MPFDRLETKKFPDLTFVEKKFPSGLGDVVEEVPEIIFVDMGVVEERFIILDAGEGVSDLAFASAQSFDLSAFEDDAGLEGLEDMIIVASLAIGENLFHRLEQIGGSLWSAPGIRISGETSAGLLGSRFVGGILLGLFPSYLVVNELK